MAQLGDGVGSGFPGVIDTSTTEVDDPGGTVISAAKINDATAAIIAIQTELGVDVAGSIVNLVTRLAVEHKAAGTHSDVTADSLVLAGKIDTVKAGDLASAATVNIGAANGLYLDITGTTTITAFDTVTAGIFRIIQFDGILTFTHNATTLILPSGVDIVTAAGDVAFMLSLGSGNWICLLFSKASGQAVAPTLASQTFTGSGSYVVPVGVTTVHIEAMGSGGGGAGSNANNRSGGGGASGGYITAVVTVTPGASITVTIGTAGTAGSSGGNGGVGGDTTFGSLVTADGGPGGVQTDPPNGGTAGTSTTTGTLIGERGIDGSDGTNGSSQVGGNGGGVILFDTIGGAGGAVANPGVSGTRLGDGGGGGGTDGAGEVGGAGLIGYLIVTPSL